MGPEEVHMSEGETSVERLWLNTALLVGSCFLLASTGWLSWMRHVMTLAEPTQTEVLTLVLGYLIQSVGISVFVSLERTTDRARQEQLALASAAGYTLLIAPSTLADSLATTLAFGYLANAICGMLQGYYLVRLVLSVESDQLGTAFGCAYGVSTVASWLLSLVGGGMLTGGIPCLAVCVALTAVVLWTIRREAQGSRINEGLQAADGATPEERPEKALLVLTFITVTMVSLVKNVGFAFPTEDLAESVNLELSRVLYGIGLVAAGIVADRDRRVSMALCAASLALPFLTLSLLGAGAPPILLWSLEYLLFGFFTVFRVTLTADLARREGLPWVAALGMLFGRIGDAFGTELSLSLAHWPLVHVAATTMVFAISMALMFMLEQKLYNAPPEAVEPKRDESELFAQFCTDHGLSAREREVLPLLIAGRTNAEIATELFVTERTIKYHVHNIMEKTGCTSRLEVVDSYLTGMR